MTNYTRQCLRARIAGIGPPTRDAWLVADSIADALDRNDYQSLTIGHRAILGEAMTTLDDDCIEDLASCVPSAKEYA